VHIFQHVNTLSLISVVTTKIKMGVFKWCLINFDSISDRNISVRDWYWYDLHDQLAFRMILP